MNALQAVAEHMHSAEVLKGFETDLGVTVLVKLLIPEVGVQLYLVDSWHNLGIL